MFILKHARIRNKEESKAELNDNKSAKKKTTSFMQLKSSTSNEFEIFLKGVTGQCNDINASIVFKGVMRSHPCKGKKFVFAHGSQLAECLLEEYEKKTKELSFEHDDSTTLKIFYEKFNEDEYFKYDLFCPGKKGSGRRRRLLQMGQVGDC